MSYTCIICKSQNNFDTYTVEELQMGIGGFFKYLLCKACGTMQIEAVPENLGQYYSNENYYSFNMELKVAKKADTLRKIKANYLIHGKQKLIGSILSLGYTIPEHYEWMKYSNTQFEDAILDIGTGNGSLLTKLHQIGFTNLTGIDPFIEKSKDYGAIKILKKDLFEVNERYQTIMMHHSLEHMLNPLAALHHAKKILTDNGTLIVRIPIMGNYGWKKYKTTWCGLDAPRHIFIPSEKAIKILFEQAGLHLEKFYYDSSDYVVWASEQYLKHIPLHAPNSYMTNPSASNFTKPQIKAMRKMMRAENKKGNGDMAVFYLTPKN